MDDQSKKKWIIRDAGGRVKGPYSTEEVIAKIKRGDFQGNEQVALFPGNDWKAISASPEFYDHLLAGLEQENSQEDIRDEGFIEDEPSGSWTEKIKEAKEPPPEDPTPKRGRAERVEHEGAGKTEKKESKSKKPKKKKVKDSDVIELKKTKKVLKKAQRRRSAKPVLILILVLVAAFIIIDMGSSSRGDAVRLLVPKKGQSPLSQEQIQSLTQKAVQEFTANNFSNLVRAQNTLVQIFEGDNRNSAALSLLCLTYLELWPMAFQDSRDLEALTSLTQLAGEADPGGIDANTCRVVDFFLKGRSGEAESTVDSVLERFGSNEKPPIVFYYLKALLLFENREFNSAISYVNSAEQLWPQWLGSFVLEADILRKAGQYELAVQKLNQILKANPQHARAQIMLGLIELQRLQNFERGEQFIQAGLNSADLVPSRLASEAYTALAEYELKQGDQSDAMDFAMEAFSLNSTNELARALIIKLGGEESLKKAQLKDRQLVFEGDQLVREGNCAGAQALYKTAFETNPKNAIAAMKAAQCLWELSLSSQAIDWLNNAIRADPKLVDAYVLLSDYYSQRYLFQSAARSLGSANGAVPNNYKVFRGYAKLELQRQNGRGAVQYAERAIGLYESDVESYVTLARAQMLLGDYNSALSAARKAQELNVNNREAQIVLGQTLYGAQGAQSAISYMQNLVSTYPLVTEYRMALGELYLKDQSYANARDLFQQVARIQEKPKKALIRLGDVSLEEQDVENALKSYLAAAALDPSDVEPLFRAGKLYLMANKPALARDQFVRVQRINQEYPLVHFYLGKAALAMDDPKGAIKEAEKEKLKNPRLADPYILAAEAHYAMKQFSLCAGEYQQAVKLRPGSAGIYVSMARCYRLAGSLDAAVSMIRIARTQESGNAEVWKERGLIYETRGDNVRAAESYNQYLVLAPTAPDAYQIRNRADRLLK